MVTAGGNMAFMNAVLAVADPGDEVILQTPFYFNHEMAVVMAGCRAVAVPTDDRYQLQVDRDPRRHHAAHARHRHDLAEQPDWRGVSRRGPAPPSTQLCAERGLWHIHDEVYEYFTYGGAQPISPGAAPGAAAHTISLYSLSKAYGFASWRIGYMVIPETLWTAVNKIQDTLLICPPHVSQAAAVGALAAGRAYCEPHVAHACRRARSRPRRASARSATSARRRRPTARSTACCAFRTSMQAMTLAERLIREHRVATAPGTAFGMEEGCYLRSRTAPWRPRRSSEGMGRLVTGLAGHRG